jgi:hypothetical protein
LGDEKTIDVLRKTARKMSPEGLEAASSLSLDDTGQRLLTEALSTPS